MYKLIARLMNITKFIFKLYSVSNVNYISKVKYLAVAPLISDLYDQENHEKNDNNNRVEVNIPVKDISNEVENAVFKGGKFLMNFIPLLEEIIVEICKQYRECIAKQMELTESAMELEIIPLRVKADELKKEIIKYENLVKSVAQSVYGQAALVLMSGDNIETLEVLQTKLRNLESLIEKEILLNKNYEYKLLAASCASILQ